MDALAAQGTLPSSVQIGNEINCGLFHNWDGANCSQGGEVCACKNNWGNLAALITACAKAVKAANPDAVIIIQYAASAELGNNDKWDELVGFYKSIASAGAEYDAIGVSFYQIWGATDVANLCNLRELATALPDKSFYIIETGYPYKPGGNSPKMLPAPQFP